MIYLLFGRRVELLAGGSVHLHQIELVHNFHFRSREVEQTEYLLDIHFFQK